MMLLRFVLIVLALVAAVHADAQGFDFSAGAQTGRVRFASYVDADIDSVSIYNGNLSLDIPLFSLPGRELSTGLRLVYNSQKWQFQDNYGWPGGVYTGGWRIADPIGDMAAYYFTEGIGCIAGAEVWRHHAGWMDGLGTKRQYVADVHVPPCGSAGPPPIANQWLAEAGGDGTQLFTGNSPAEAFIRLKDGSSIEFSATPVVRSANGNFLRRDNATRLPFIDTLGRAIGFQRVAESSGHADIYTVSDSNGVSQPYRLSYEDGFRVWNPLLRAWQQRDGRLKTILLPNGGSYAFEYANFQGFLTKVTLPSGASFSYEYPASSCDLVQYPAVCSDPDAAGKDFVIARRARAAANAAPAVWSYQRIAYDPNVRDVIVTTPEGNVTIHKFNSSGQETETQWKDGAAVLQRVTKTWSTDGTPNVITTILDGIERRTTLAFTAQKDLAQQDETDWGTSAPGPLLSRTIHGYGLFNDVVPRLVFSEQRGIDPVTGSFAVQGKTEFFYDEFPVVATAGNIPNKSTPAGSRNNLTTVRRYSDAASFVAETFRYDDLGNVLSHTDPVTHTTQQSYADNFINEAGAYDTFAFPTSETNAAGHSIQTQYDYRTGLVTRSWDPRNKTTLRSYDWAGRLKTVTSPDSSTSRYDYDDGQRTVFEQKQAGAATSIQTQTSFDTFYRPVETLLVDPAGNVRTTIEYDNDGRIRRVSEPYRGSPAAWTTTQYDRLDRPVSITNPDATIQQLFYLGNSVRSSDEAGNLRWRTYNGLGQLTQVQEPNVTVTAYSYYVFGPLHKVTQPSLTGLPPRTFAYDWLSRLQSESHPESGTTVYQRDAGTGLVRFRTDARNLVTGYSYDNIGRVLAIDYADATPDVTYVYDENGQAGFLTTAAVNAVTTASFQYDDAGRLHRQQVRFDGVPGIFAATYGYDLAGRIANITYPSGRVVAHTYQAAGSTATGRIQTIIDATTNKTILSNIADNPAGLVTAQTLGGMIAETHGFNARNQLTEIAAGAGGVNLLNLGYDYGVANNGRIRSRTDLVQPEHSAQYTYDGFNRLQSVAGASANWTIRWGFDAAGNRISQTPSGLATSKIGSITAGYQNNRNLAFGYDAAGDVTNDGVHSYSYDAENRIQQVDGGAVRYAYDSDGRRIRRTAGTTTTYYLYGLTGLMSEFSTGTTLSAAPSASPADRLEYRIAEHTGTAVLSISSTGTILENNRVLPYGEPWSPTAASTASTNDQKFTSYDRDLASGLDYAMARFYSSRTGRFASPDPAPADPSNPQTWNRYVYALNDAINLVDPFGTCSMGADGKMHDDLGGPCVGAGGNVTGVTTRLPGITSRPATASGLVPNGVCVDVMQNGVFIGNTCDGGATSGGADEDVNITATPQCVASGLRAVIAVAEGTAGRPGGGYGTVALGKVVGAPPQFANLIGTFNAQVANPAGLAGHPNILVQVNRTLRSTAFGRYQILGRTAASYGFKDFSPAGQNAAADALLRRRRMINPALQGNVEQAIRNGGKEWASLPGSPYGQPKIPMSKALTVYAQAVAGYCR